MKKGGDNSKCKRGRMSAGARPVSEGARIDIAKVIAEFQASDNQGIVEVVSEFLTSRIAPVSILKSLVNCYRLQVSS